MTIQKRLARSNIAMLAIPLITAAVLCVDIGELVYRPGMGPGTVWRHSGAPDRRGPDHASAIRQAKTSGQAGGFVCSFYLLTAGCLSGRRTPGTW